MASFFCGDKIVLSDFGIYYRYEIHYKIERLWYKIKLLSLEYQSESNRASFEIQIFAIRKLIRREYFIWIYSKSHHSEYYRVATLCKRKESTRKIVATRVPLINVFKVTYFFGDPPSFFQTPAQYSNRQSSRRTSGWGRDYISGNRDLNYTYESPL